VATLAEYFNKDFSRYMTTAQEHTVTNTAIQETTKVTARVHQDYEACSKFGSLFIPSGAPTKDIIFYYADDISRVLKVTDGVLVKTGFGRLGMDTSSEQLNFTGRLFVYSENELDGTSLTQVTNFAKSKGLHLVFRSQTYSQERSRYERPLAFISHDSRDKLAVAAPIALGLQKLMCPVWYDEYSLKVGDSLRESIERGIKAASTCVVVLSKNFFSNNGWTKAEFDSIYVKEIIEKKRVMLPVWVDVSKEDVYEYSPRLVDRVGVSMALGIDEVVRRLHHAIEAKQIGDAT